MSLPLSVTMHNLLLHEESTATSIMACETPPTITSLVTSAKPDVPSPGHIYMICQRTGSGVLTLLDGEVIVVDGVNPHGAVHWACETKWGYWGFRNTAAGGFLSQRR